jgi:hypothetical protein
LKHQNFPPKVKEIWCEPIRDVVPLDKVLFKIKKVKRFLKGWGLNLLGSTRKRKQQILNELRDLELLEEISPLNDDPIVLRMELKIELFKIQEEEDTYWYRMSMKTGC